MTYKDIANMPTSLYPEDVRAGSEFGMPKGWHESLLRSYHIVQKVKWLLEKKTDPEVIVELIALMEPDEFQPYGGHVARYHREHNHPKPLNECEDCARVR